MKSPQGNPVNPAQQNFSGERLLIWPVLPKNWMNGVGGRVEGERIKALVGKNVGGGGRQFGGKGRSKTTGQARVGLNYLYYLKGVSYYYQRILVILLFF